MLWFCETCLVRIRGFIRTEYETKDSPKDLSLRSQNLEKSEILNSEERNSNITNPTTSKNNNQKWRTVNSSLKQPKGAGNIQIVETKNKYSILGRIEDSVDCELTLVGDSIIREQVDIFCNRGRKIRNRLCIPWGNVKKYFRCS